MQSGGRRETSDMQTFSRELQINRNISFSRLFIPALSAATAAAETALTACRGDVATPDDMRTG